MGLFSRNKPNVEQREDTKIDYLPLTATEANAISEKCIKDRELELLKNADGELTLLYAIIRASAEHGMYSTHISKTHAACIHPSVFEKIEANGYHINYDAPILNLSGGKEWEEKVVMISWGGKHED